MVEPAFQYRAIPEDEATAQAAWSDIQIGREVYNHFVTQEYRPEPDHNKPSYTQMQNQLPELKEKWPKWKQPYSKCLQMAVRRIKQSEEALDSLKERGYNVGRLKWKAPREYRSITYNQRGFDVDSNTSRAGHAVVNFSKIGDFHLNYHRPLPDDAEIIEVILKKQKTGNWTVSIVTDYDADHPEKPAVDDIDVEDTVGIDLGITKFIHDSENRTFARLDEEDDRERIDRRHRDLSSKKYGSKNWEKARKALAKAYQRLNNRREDYREKIAHWYTTRYDIVFLEDLDVAEMMRQDKNARNIAAMSWYETIQTFERHGDKNGCHVILVDPRGTTKQCARCGVSSDKPLWVREHSCPACQFTVDRDYNSSLEVQQRGLDKLGVEYEDEDIGLGQSESMSVETGVAAGERRRDALLASTVSEAESLTREHGSPNRNEAVPK